MKLQSLLICCVVIFLFGCAGKKSVTAEKTSVEVTETTNSDNATIITEAASQIIETENSSNADNKKTDKSQVYIVARSDDPGALPQKNEPEPLKQLLEPKTQKQETAVSKMRPEAIREAAQLATFQKAISWRYEQLLKQTENFALILDTAFNFSPLLLTQGQAVIMPPVLAKGGASMRIEDGDTVTTAKSTYELLEPAKYISSSPTWREFLMVDSFPKPEEPNPALLPKTSSERAIWRKAVRKAWQEGIVQADQLFADNVARMTREYRGIMLYHLLTAQHLLSKINTASTDLGRYISGNKLNIGQQVYRITRPSSFIPASTKIANRDSGRRKRK